MKPIIFIPMKVEIDLSDPVQLRKTRGELQRYLSIIEYALSPPNPVNGRPSVTPPLPMSLTNTENGNGVRGTDMPVRNIIQTLPNRFTTTDIAIRFGDEAKERRGAIKASINRLVEEGIIRVHQAGKGRRPTTFEKAVSR